MIAGKKFDTSIKYDKPNNTVYVNYMENAFVFVQEQLKGFVSMQNSEPLFEDLMDYVDFSTSPGFPGSIKFKSKEAFFSNFDVWQRLLYERATGDYVRDYLWTGFNKPEIIKKSKDVRQICGCESALLFHVFPLVHQFNKSLEVAGHGLPLFLGTTFEGSDFQVYVSKFEGRQCMATDASGFDASISSQLYVLALRLRLAFLTVSLHDKLKFFYKQIIRKWIVENDGAVVYVDHGTASGQPSTAHDNSLIMWLLMISFLLRFYTAAELNDNLVELAIYGDDCVIGIVSDIRFSLEQLKTYFATHGIVLKASGFVSFQEADFLSRVPFKTRLGYVPVFLNHQKLLASAFINDNPLGPFDYLMKLMDLRSKLAGTPSFAKIHSRCESELEHYKGLLKSNGKLGIVLKRFMTEEDCLLSRSHRYFSAGGNLKSISQPKNIMSFQNKNAKTGNKGMKKVTLAKPSNKSGPLPSRLQRAKNKQKARRRTNPQPQPQSRAMVRMPKSANSVIQNLEKKEVAGAVNIVRTMANPSKCSPIRFPNLGDLKVGTSPWREKYQFALPFYNNGTYSTAYVYGGLALFNWYYAPSYVVTGLGNTGALTWSSTGQPSSYTAINTNAARMRMNAVSAKLFSFEPTLYDSGRVAIIQFENYDSSGVNFPATVASILNNPMTQIISIKELAKREFVVYNELNGQLDFVFPSSNASIYQSNSTVILFINPYNTSAFLSGGAVQAEITLQAEYIPETSYQVLTTTAATNVSEDALQKASTLVTTGNEVAGGNNGIASKVSKTTLGDLWDFAKDAWDFASPFVSAIGGFLGFLEPHIRSAVKDALLIYQLELHALHAANPTIVTVDHLIQYHLGLLPHRLLIRHTNISPKCWYHPENHDSHPLHKHLVHRIFNRLNPLAISCLRQHGMRLEAPAYSVDSAALVNPDWTIHDAKLWCKDVWVANLSIPSDTLWPISFVNLNAMIIDDGIQPIVQVFLVDRLYSQPIVNTTVREFVMPIPPLEPEQLFANYTLNSEVLPTADSDLDMDDCDEKKDLTTRYLTNPRVAVDGDEVRKYGWSQAFDRALKRPINQLAVEMKMKLGSTHKSSEDSQDSSVILKQPLHTVVRKL
jgi:hypothetical protein